LLSPFKLPHNGFRLAAGGALKHYRSFGKPHFNYTKKLSTETLHPRLRQTDVGGSIIFLQEQS
jgi:hypothetical protein